MTTTSTVTLGLFSLLALLCACALAYPARLHPGLSVYGAPEDAENDDLTLGGALQELEDAMKRAGGRMPIAAPMWFHSGKRQGPIAAPLWFHTSGRGKKSPPAWYLPAAAGPVKRSAERIAPQQEDADVYDGNH